MTKQVRNIIFATIAVLALYTLCGFFLVPSIAKSQMQKNLQATLGSQPQIREITFNPFTFKMQVLGFQLPEADPRAGRDPRLQFEEFSIQLAIFPLLKKELRFNEVLIKSAKGKIIVFKDGKTNWVVKPNPESKSNAKEEKSNWILTLEYIQIDNSGMHISDNTHVTPLELPLGPFSLRAANISTSLGSETSLKSLSIAVGENGHLKVNGSFSQTPLSADMHLDIAGLPLDFVTAYLSDKSFLILRKGTIDLLGNLKYNTGNLSLTGASEIHDLNLSLPDVDEPAIAWKSLKVDGIQFNTRPMQFHVTEMNLNGLKTAIVLQKDGSLNYKKFLRSTPSSSPPPPPATTAAPEKQEAFDYLISKLNLTDGAVSYSDQQIKPSFSAHIHNVSGSIGPISPQVNEKINIDLKGQVETYGKFSGLGYFIRGEKRPSLDLGMGFHNIEMTTFTPYSGRFAGYEISKGKLFLDLKYTLANNRIQGKNQVLLDQFTLGKKVDSEHATNLPLKLALALMKDRNGQIKFKLPVEGDINSPSFSWGNLIFTALKNMLINILAAPFDFISNLVGGGEDLQRVAFEAGTTELVPEENGKVQSLAKALEERPNLALEIQGEFHPQDVEALKLKDLNHRLEPQLKKYGGDRAKAVQVLAKSILSKDEMKSEDLEKALLAKIVIPDDQLKALALARGQVVIAALAENKIPTERLYLLAAAKGEEGKGPQVSLKLKEK